jgi:fatty-acyl-CoA synthase
MNGMPHVASQSLMKHQDGGGVLSSPWLPWGQPTSGRIARAALRYEGDRTEIQRYDPSELLPGKTAYECLEAAATLNPGKAALIQLESIEEGATARTISYAQMMQLLRQAANMFRDIAGPDRSSVALILPMVPEALIATWAAQTAGVACPINPYLEVDAVTSILNAAKATVLVMGNSEKHGAGVWGKLQGIEKKVPTLRHILIVDSAQPSNDFLQALQSYEAAALSFKENDAPYADMMYLPTGGTTGAPKLVRMSHRGQLLNAWSVGAIMGSDVEAVVGHAMPNFHVGGLIVIALRTMIYGQTLVTLTADGFRNPLVVKNFWNIARHYRITSVLATPTTATSILAVNDSDSAGHCIKTFSCGASTVPVELLRAFHKRFGIWLREVWGMSEIHGVVTASRNDGREPTVGSVGQCLPYHVVKAVEVDDANRFLRECAVGERGVLAIMGPGVTQGYVDENLDKEFFILDMPGDQRWACTGDLGSVDKDGNVWIYGRAKDVIIRGGHNIDPKLIEEVLVRHPAVLNVAAIGRPDAEKGELPIAYVELKQGHEVNIAELFSLCKEHVQERAAHPVDIIIIERIPLTAVGKINKPILRVEAMLSVTKMACEVIVSGRGHVEVSIDESGRRPLARIRLVALDCDRDALAQNIKMVIERYPFAAEIVHE